jgi:glycosyltransferase involved in cell wall biosynthesis
MTNYLIIPCYNEESRWNVEYFESILLIDNLKILFVDDGSSDLTKIKIKYFSNHDKVEILFLPSNLGKANAICEGIKKLAQNKNVELIGFLDADGAFEVSEIEEILNIAKTKILIEKTFESVWSSRINLAGRNIDRKLYRHFIGRIVAHTISNRNLKLPYDTQCGYKWFLYRKDKFEFICRKPFTTKWFIDLEIMARWKLCSGTSLKIWEEPLKSWKDMSGSSIDFKAYLGILSEVIKIKLLLKGL